MISMGRLASGLAHELNNPASATVRDAQLLRIAVDNLNMAWGTLSKAGLTHEQYDNIDIMRHLCLRKFDNKTLSPIEKSDQQDKIANWLNQKDMDSDLAVSLADTNISLADLDKMVETIHTETRSAVLKWIVASCNVQTLTVDMENSANQIYKLVDVVKKFTFMDNLTENEFQDIEQGLRDTIRVLDSKIKLKNAMVKLEIDANLPQVHVNGSEINQVWLNLIDNSLDAISSSGNIKITAAYELNRVVVRIKDDGTGIPADMIPRIFDPFFTTKPPGQGTGLGLDLTRRLLRRYKGDISVSSKPGNTEFRVSLIAGTVQPAHV